jgi:hypothetical protein
MTGIIHFIDHNHGLLENHIFIAMCWNMIRSSSNIFLPIDIKSISYFSQLEIPHSSCFSFLTNRLDTLDRNRNYINFIKNNPNIVSRKEHVELYNLIYYSELKRDNQIDFFFNSKPKTLPVFNVVDHEFYYITFDCNTLDKNLNYKMHPFIYDAFSKNHPFFLFYSKGDTFKFRAITHFIPSSYNGSLDCTKIGIYHDPLLGNRTSYAVNVGYEVPKSFISKMSKININKKADAQIYKTFLSNNCLVTMPKHMINPLQLSIYSNFHYNEFKVDCIESIEHNNLYNDSFKELKQKIKLHNSFKYKPEIFFNEKSINIETQISKQWKKI